jgi:hypothetical protein
MNNDIRPEGLIKYDRYAQNIRRVNSTGGGNRRVKIDQGHTWRIRLLPVTMGKHKDTFVPLAQHWFNKTPMTCPKHTPEEWGGDPNYDCPICGVAARLANSPVEEIKKMGFRVGCSIRTRMWCIVVEKEDHRGNVEEIVINDMLIPYEFDMFKTTWENFCKYQKWALTGKRTRGPISPDGLLDLETGYDLLATASKNGIVLDRCDPNPIFPLEDQNYDRYIKKIWEGIKKPIIDIPKEVILNETAMKIQEDAQNKGRGGDGGSQRRRGEDYENEEEDEQPRSRSRSRYSHLEEEHADEAPTTRSPRAAEMTENEEKTASAEPNTPPPRRQGVTHAPVAEAEDELSEETTTPPRRRSTPAHDPVEETDTTEETTTPPPRRHSVAPSPVEKPTVPQQKTEAPSAAARKLQQRAQEAAQQDAGETEAEAEPEPEPEPESEPEQTPTPAAPPPAHRGIAPTSPPLARRAPRTESGVDDEEDNAPEEANDPAPAENNRPPAVSAQAPAPKRAGNVSELQQRLANLKKLGK